MNEPNASGRNFGLLGLMVIQIFIGYEWLVSGLAKVIRGGFPSGLADELTEKSEGVPAWYKSFLDGAVIPNGDIFGYLIELGEVAIGVAMIGAVLLWLFAWQRLSNQARLWTLWLAAAAAIGGVFMNVNFHLANGSSHPWLIPASGFDEGVDLDSLMPAVELVLAAVGAGFALSIKKSETVPNPATLHPGRGRGADGQ